MARLPGRTHPTGPEDGSLPFWLRAALLTLLVCGLTWTARNLRPDDALIYARYVQNALAGHGLVFNAGERVNALTSPLDTWLLLGFSCVLHGRILLAQTLLGAAFFLAATLLAERAVPASGIVLAAMPYFYQVHGMESSLFLFLVLLTVQAAAAGHTAWLPLLSVLTVLARLEGAALAALVAVLLVRRGTMPSARSFLPAVLVLGGWLAFNLHLYGAALPQSALAKLGQGSSGLWKPFTAMPGQLFQPLFTSRAGLLPMFVLTCFGARRLRAQAAILLPFLALVGGVYVAFRVPNYLWYYAPFVFFAVYLAMANLPRRRAAQLAATALAVALAAAGVPILRHTNFVTADYRQAAEWLHANTPADATVAAAETGTIAFYSQRPVVDMIGLTTPDNAAYTARGDVSSWFRTKPPPDWIVVHTDDSFEWERVALASPAYAFAPVRFGEVSLLKRRKAADPAAPLVR